MPDIDKHIEKLVKMLQNPKASKRYEACEYLRVAPTITPEAINALQNALNDTDAEVADAAQRALALHTQQAKPNGSVGIEGAMHQPKDLSNINNNKKVSFLFTIGIGIVVALFTESVVFGLIFGLRFRFFVYYFFELWFLTIPQLLISIVGALLGRIWRKTWSAAWLGAVVGTIISIIILLIILFNGLRIY